MTRSDANDETDLARYGGEFFLMSKKEPRQESPGVGWVTVLCWKQMYGLGRVIWQLESQVSVGAIIAASLLKICKIEYLANFR